MLTRLGIAWEQLGRRASEPATRARPWETTLVVLALVGTAAGLLRLAIGFWAITLCRRRGHLVDDPPILARLEKLRHAMGCRRAVTLLEVPDLTTPATSGRRRPLLLLPGDWRSWSDSELHAVLAHELAHIVRGDYAMGLLARLAVVLNYYHPLVWLMAGRLQLQQEQAADAIGARFAGGRARYLVALSNLALRQDGRSPSWPARAFLPTRGTLIRRIAMLRNDRAANFLDQPLSSPRRMITVSALVGLALIAAALRGPARGADDGPTRPVTGEAETHKSTQSSISDVAFHVRNRTDGVIFIRPAAALHHKGMEPLVALCQKEFGVDLSLVAKELKIDTNSPGFMKIRVQDVDWLSVGISFDKDRPNAKKAKTPTAAGTSEKPLHRVEFGSPTIRMVEPFDWLAFARQWRCEFEDARVNGQVYYKITGTFKELFGANECFFMPDDRTLVIDEENVIRAIASGQGVRMPEYLRSQEWERASRGLVAFAIHPDNTFAERYGLGRPDDAIVLSILKGVDTWIGGVDDSETIVVRAGAKCNDRESAAAVKRSVDPLVQMGRQFFGQWEDESTDHLYVRALRLVKGMATNARVERTDNAVTVRSQDFGTLAEFAAIVDSLNRQSTSRTADASAAKASATR
jgi:beta-lactamase regulating signal transducer with metallopeptidase domain